jgi:hypothetical protein
VPSPRPSATAVLEAAGTSAVDLTAASFASPSHDRIEATAKAIQEALEIRWNKPAEVEGALELVTKVPLERMDDLRNSYRRATGEDLDWELLAYARGESATGNLALDLAVEVLEQRGNTQTESILTALAVHWTADPRTLQDPIANDLNRVSDLQAFKNLYEGHFGEGSLATDLGRTYALRPWRWDDVEAVLRKAGGEPTTE